MIQEINFNIALVLFIIILTLFFIQIFQWRVTMKKRIMSFVMTLCIITSVFPMSIATTKAGVYIYCKFSYDKVSHTLTFYNDDRGTDACVGRGVDYSEVLGKYGANESDVETIVMKENNRIALISDSFANFVNLKNLHLPSSITYIDEDAFYGCRNLSKVYISDISAWCNTDISFPGVLRYGANLYLDNKLVTDLYIPDGVKQISAYSFFGCKSIKTVRVPDSVEYIGGLAFCRCENLETIDFGNGLKKIYSEAFGNCEKLTYLKFPDSLDTIGNSAFNGCTNIENISFGKNVSSIGEYAFARCKKLKSVAIPDKVSSISLDAFIECSNLRSVILPKTIEIIDNYAYHNCPSLSDVYYEGSAVDWSKITINKNNDDLINAKIHYNSSIKKDLDNISETAMINEYGSYLEDNASITTLRQAQDVCSDILGCYNTFDQFKMSLFTALRKGLGFGVVSQETLASIGLSPSMEEEMVDECVKDFLNDYFSVKSATNNDISSKSKKIWEGFRNVYSIINSTNKYMSNDEKKNEIAKSISKTTNYTKSDITKAMERFDKFMNGADYAITSIEAVASSALLAQYEKETIDDMLYYVKNGFGTGCDLYNGLVRVKRDLNNLDSYVAKHICKEKIVSKMKSAFENLMVESVGGSTTMVKTAQVMGSLVSLIYENNGGEFAEDYIKACDSVSIAACFYWSTLMQNTTDGQRLMFDCCVSATRVALEKAKSMKKSSDEVELPYMLACTTYKNQANYYLKKVNQLSYDVFLKQCKSEILNYKDIAVYGTGGASYNQKSKSVYSIGTTSDSSLESDDSSAETEVTTLYDDNTLVIPTLINGINVTEINNNGFSELTDISGVVLPNSITKIGDYSFFDCSSVEFFMLGENIQSIGEGAFKNCSSLNMLSLPDELISIGASSFENCSSLKNIKFGSSLEKIDDSAFLNCTSLETITFYNPNTVISENAFENCSDDCVIYGYAGSTAEEFSNINGNSFISLGDIVESISISSPATKTVFSYGEDISTDGLSICVNYLDGTTAEIKDGFSVSVSSLEAGKQVVEICYENVKTTYDIFINETFPSSISIGNNLYLLAVGDTAELNIVMEPDNTSQGEYSIVSNDDDVVIVEDNSIQAVGVGETEVTVATENGLSTKCKVIVSVIKNLEFDGEYIYDYVEYVPEETNTYTFTCGDDVEITVYDDNYDLVNSIYNDNGVDVYSLTKNKNYILQVSLTKNSEKTVNIIPTIRIPEIKGINVASKNENPTYYVGDKLSKADLVVKVLHDDGTERQIYDFDVQYDFSSVGDCDIVVTYLDYQTQITVNVKEVSYITYYFLNDKNWDTVYAYNWYYDSSHNAYNSAEWPGTEMKYVCDNEKGIGIYSIDVPSNMDYIIFNNGSGQQQTVDVLLSDYSSYNAFRLVEGSLKYDVEGWVYSENISIPKETQSTTSPTFSSTDTSKTQGQIGDVNGDGNVDVADATILQKYLNKIAISINIEVADTNGDGTVNIQDVTHIQKYLAGLVTSLV